MPVPTTEPKPSEAELGETAAEAIKNDLKRRGEDDDHHSCKEQAREFHDLEPLAASNECSPKAMSTSDGDVEGELRTAEGGEESRKARRNVGELDGRDGSGAEL